MGIQAYMHVHIYAEARAGFQMPFLCSLCYFETGSLAEPGAHHSARLAWPVSSLDPHVSIHHMHVTFYMGSGDSNSSPQARRTRLLPTQPSLQAWVLPNLILVFLIFALCPKLS